MKTLALLIAVIVSVTARYNIVPFKNTLPQ